MDLAALNKVANQLCAPGRGILAADESNTSITKRFTALKIESTETARRDYREMLFRTPGFGEHLSGVILYDETIRQKAVDGTPLVKLLERAGSIPGIKVDEGPYQLAGAATGETITKGLDGLPMRLKEYYELGARFAKWRGVIDIGEVNGKKIPTWGCIKANAHALARYAADCQAANIVPIVEPEVLMDGAHGIERCAEVTTLVLQVLYREMFDMNVALEGTILKPNMVIAGKKSPKQNSVEEVARETLRVLKECVPPAVPGIAFLSGGQSDEDATAHLDAMIKMGPLPWKLTFSYGRALHATPMTVWAGNNANNPKAQTALAHRAKMNGLASLGQWQKKHEAA